MLNERYSGLQRRLDNLYDDRLDNKISREFWEKKQQEINEAQATLLEQINRVKSEETKYFEIWLNIMDLARRAREIYEKRTPEERRMLLKHVFSMLTLKDGETTYELKESVSVLAKRVQEKIDLEKNFELQQKTTKSIASSGSLRKINNHSSMELPEAQNNFRTSKKSSVKPRQEACTSLSRPLLRG